MLDTEQKVQLDTVLKIGDEIDSSKESVEIEKLREDLFRIVGQYDKKTSKELHKQLKAIQLENKKDLKLLAKSRSILKQAMRSKEKEIRERALDINKKRLELMTKIRNFMKQIQQLNRALMFRKFNLLLYLVFTLFSVGFFGVFKYFPLLSFIWAVFSSISLIVWKTLDIFDYLDIVKTSRSRKVFLFISKSRLPLALLLPNAFIISAFCESVIAFVICVFLVLISETMCFLCDMFWQSDLFNDKEDSIVLVITLFFGALLLVPLIPKNSFVNLVLNGFLIGFSLLLTSLCIKKCISESHSFTDDSSITNFLIFVGSTIFITIYTFYRLLWHPEAESQPLFAAIVGVYAAILGGTITLSGVAWTIRQGQKERAEDRKHLEEDRKQEEIKRAKPLFSFSMVFVEESKFNDEKVCFVPGKKEYKNFCHFYIDNSEQSAFSMRRIFHDKEWHVLGGNYVCLPNSKTLFLCRFTIIKDVVLEIEDCLGNFYYYELRTLPSLIPNKKENNSQSQEKEKSFTIHEIIELSLDELKKRNIPLEDTP